MKIAITLLLLIGLTGMTGTICWILRRGNNSRMTKLFIMCQASIALWIISQLMILFSESRRQLWISYLTGDAGICCFSPFWLMFSAEYTKSGIRRFNRLFPALSLVMFTAIAMNPLHGLYYSSFSKDSIEYGPMFYAFQVLFYIFIIEGIVLLITRNNGEYSSIMLVLATAVPLGVNTLTVSGIIKTGTQITPLFFAFSVMMILIAVRRFGFLNINRIAINDTIDNISTGVIIYDTDGNMTYHNRYAGIILDSLGADSLREGPDIQIDGKFYSIRKNRCVNKKGEKIAEVMTINNVSEYYELARTEKQLSLEQERNRIAQEIHDSAGHTFTMISSLAKILTVEADREKSLEYINEIDGLSRSGITQLRCSINNLRDDEFMTSVTRAVNTVTAALRDIKAEVCVQGTEDERFSFCVREVYEDVRETLTNAMRYSGAQKIDIIVKFTEQRLELYIFDNGSGCAEINEHNGLCGIRERTEKIGGSVRFSSAEGEGFTTVIKIPVR